MKEKEQLPIQDTYFSKEWREERQKKEAEVHWYAARVTGQHERKIVDKLNFSEVAAVKKRNGEYVTKYPLPAVKEIFEANPYFEAFVPIKKEVHVWSDRKRTVEVVQTPGVIFIRTCLRDRYKIYEACRPHLQGFICHPGEKVPEAISDAAMQSFIALTQESESIELADASTFKTGDKIRMLDGALKGRVFWVVAAKDPKKANGDQELTIRIELNSSLFYDSRIKSSRVIKVDANAVDELYDNYN